MHGDDAEQLALDVSSALGDYANLFREAVRIAADGTSADELADWAGACWDGAVELRVIDADELRFTAGAPREVGELVRELYESCVVFSGVERVAHVLSLPLASCATGETLAPLIDRRSPVADWCARVTGVPFEPPQVPRSLVRPNWRDSSALAVYAGARRQLAANADRESDEGSDAPRDLDSVFAGRLSDAIGVYGEAVARARALAPGDGAVRELQAWTRASARHAAPALVGFARLTDRRQAGLHPPSGAASVARAVADGLVTLAAAESVEDFTTLPYPDPVDIAERARPLVEWLSAT